MSLYFALSTCMYFIINIRPAFLGLKSKNYVNFLTIFYFVTGQCARVVSNRDEQKRIIRATHSGLGDTKEAQALSGHLGRDKTQAKVKERFYWPTITKDVSNFVKICDTCQRTNNVLKKTRGQLQPLPVKPEAFQRLGIDLVGPLVETKDGFKYFATAVCAYTKWVESEPLKNKSAVEVANFIYRMICRHGCFEIQLNDQGREFVNKVSTELHKLTGVEQRVTSAYHPQCNGLTERQNQTTQNMLLKYLDNQEQWADLLPSVLFAYRTSKHSSTGFSPFFLLFGRQPRLPVDLMVENQPKDTSIEEKITVMERIRSVACGEIPANSDIDSMGSTIEDEQKEVEAMQEQRLNTSKIAMENIAKAQERQKRNYNKRCNPNNFEDGDEVLMAVVRNKNRCGGKFDERYAGPYKIVTAVTNGVYRLQRENKVLKKSVNGNRLKPYYRQQKEEIRSHADTLDEQIDVQSAIPRFQSMSPEQIDTMLRHRYWLTDIEINNAQALLKHQYPGVHGLQDTCLSSVNRFVVETGQFLQIYNANKSHWILLSTIGCSEDNIFVYDSFYRYLHADTCNVISQLTNFKNDNITVIMPAIQRQTNGSSCGLFAVAFATSLLMGNDPCMIAYDQSKMRQHLKDCFTKRLLTEFPQSTKAPFMQETTVIIPNVNNTS